MNYFNNISKGSFICLFFVLILFNACISDKPIQHKLAGTALGTSYHITYLGEKIDRLESSVDSIVFVINHSLSTYQENSLISCFNNNTKSLWDDPEEAKHFETDMAHFKHMVELSKEISDKTAGAFDPSSGCLFDEYLNAKKMNEYMSQMTVKSCLEHQGMDKIGFDSMGYPFKIDSFVQLNFNAIAKGYLVDLIGNYFNQIHRKNYMIEVGGEVIVKGMNSSEKPWKLGINTPLIDANPLDFFEVIELENQALATSGNYQNFYVVDGNLIGHTLDPRSGKPIINELRSASVFHESCAVADAYATACMTLGLEESKKIVSIDSSLSAYFIYENDSTLEGVFVR
jgi:thiamine biosynthesis lipoprotein